MISLIDGIIKMPYSLKSEKNDILYLLQKFDEIENSSLNEIVLDYSNTVFFASELYGLYHYMVNRVAEKGINVKGINVPESVDVAMHLSDAYKKEDNPRYSTAILCRDFSFELSKNNLNCFDEYMKKELLPKIIQNNYIEDILTSYLSELFINARTHGRTTNIICGGQKYLINGKIKFIVVDFGVTIPYNIENYIIGGKKNYFHDNDGEAIRWATKIGNTTKEKLGGLGLNSIKEFIGECGGRIQIFSRNGFYCFGNMEVSIDNINNAFYGTLIVIELDLAKIKKMPQPKKTKSSFEI